jgi:16S rRNA (cytidine1402-2'-O)-methyltransferase
MNDETASHRGTLFVVATPIGNLEDITLRALKVLGDVDVIACEDTRRTALLLNAYKISKPLVSYFEHNEERRARELLKRLSNGAKVALVTDAGTPGISDPGYRLVHGAHAAGYPVIPVPGPCAVTTALSVSGLGASSFCFAGFLPARPAAQRNALVALKHEPRTLVFFEAARRLVQSLSLMATVFGDERRAIAGRELTKAFEEIMVGTLSELAARCAATKLRGEFTLVVAGAPKLTALSASDQPDHAISSSDAGLHVKESLTIEMLREAGLSLKQASSVMARVYGLSRRQAYRLGTHSDRSPVSQTAPAKREP